MLSGTSSQPDSAKLTLPRILRVSTICPVIDLDGVGICYRYMMRPDRRQLSMFCEALDARLWHILSPNYNEPPDSGDACQSWSRNLAESIAISDEENIKAE